MTRKNLIKFVTINLAFVIAILIPFIPGPPNKFAIGLSAFIQAIGFFGLVPLSLGLMWTLLKIKKWKNSNQELINRKRIYYVAIIATIIISLASTVLAIAVVKISNVFTSAFLLLGIVAGVYSAIEEIKKIKLHTHQFSSLPLYLISVPLLAFLTGHLIVGFFSDYSRDFAIKRSEVLIASIEQYKSSTGKYPESLDELKANGNFETPGPFVIGITGFRYNKIHEHYSLSFSQWLACGSLEEIVLYDKYNSKAKLEGKYATYDYKFDLCRVKGAFTVRETKFENWQSYLLD